MPVATDEALQQLSGAGAGSNVPLHAFVWHLDVLQQATSWRLRWLRLL